MGTSKNLCFWEAVAKIDPLRRSRRKNIAKGKTKMKIFKNTKKNKQTNKNKKTKTKRMRMRI